MASNKRKRVFPKPPKKLYYGVREKGTAEDLGKNSNKGSFYASLKAIYYKPMEAKKPSLDQRQVTQLAKLRENLERRKHAKAHDQGSTPRKD